MPLWLLAYEEREGKESSTLFEAVRTIVLADVVMSLDNILAVGGAAHGDLWLLLFGLVLSMPIIIFGGNLVALLMGRLPWLVYLGAGILVYTAGQMFFDDAIVGQFLPDMRWFEWGVIAALVIGILGLASWRNAHRPKTSSLSAG